MISGEEKYLHKPVAPDMSNWPFDVLWIMKELKRRGLTTVGTDMTDLPKLDPAAVANILAFVLRHISPAGRAEIMGHLRTVYCQYCGEVQPKDGYCQCDNDE